MMNYLTKLYQLGALPVIRPGSTQKLTIGTTSLRSEAVTGNVARLVATVDCHVEFGPSPTATAASLFLPANTPEYFACYGTDVVAAISDGADGALYITPAAGV
jgi:hypothetical protein